MVLHGVARHCITLQVLYGIARLGLRIGNHCWHCLVLPGIVWYCMTLLGIAGQDMVLYGIAKYCVAL